MLDLQRTVADLVLEHSACAAVFQRHRIDFCCKGSMTIDAASRAKGVDPQVLIKELERAVDERRGQPAEEDLRTLSTPSLCAHIVTKHHDYLRRALPFVRTLSAKVARVHGDHNPKLRELDAVVVELSDMLIPHLDTEEQTLFPAVMAKAPPMDVVTRELASMREEHLGMAALLDRLHAATDEFSLPEWACNSYRTLFAELQGLESDLLTHVHLENHVLAPRFVQAS